MKQLSPSTLPPFERFSSLANKYELHNTDWNRFYEFVLACFNSHFDPVESDLRVVFEQAGFPEHSVSEMLTAYRHCRGVLNAREPEVRRT